MSEKLTENSPEQTKESRVEAILLGCIESISIGAKIFAELPIDPITIDGVEYKDCQKDSIIVLADDKSFLGSKVCDYMIDSDELASDRDSDKPSEIFSELVTRKDIETIKSFWTKIKIDLPPYAENQITVVVISDEQKVITLPLHV